MGKEYGMAGGAIYRRALYAMLRALNFIRELKQHESRGTDGFEVFRVTQGIFSPSNSSQMPNK